jgi:hypothetical protein
MAEKITPIENKIITYLSLNPDRNLQQIQRGIGLDDRNYPTVKNAMERLLTKKRFVQYKKGLSEKKIEIKIFRLNTRGILVALTINKDNELNKTLDNYKNTSNILSILYRFVSQLKEPTKIKVLRNSGDLALRNLSKKHNKDTMMNVVALNALSGYEDFTFQEMQEIAVAAINVEEMKASLKQAFALGNKLFSE